MAARTRSRTGTSVGYDKQMFVGNVWYDGPVSTLTQSGVCTDVTGSPRLDHTLSVISYDSTGFTGISGATTNPLYAGSHCSGIIPQQVAPVFKDGFGSVSLPTDANASTLLQSRSNPGRPGVTPLSLIQDLRDIPKMLKDVGRLARAPHKLLTAKEIANQNLAIRFGWVPLIHDINDLMDLGKTINQRKMELQSLYSGHGLRRRLKLGKSTVVDTLTGTFSYNVHQSGFTASRTTTGEKWGVCHWKPTVAPGLLPGEDALLKQATKAVSGMTTAGLFNGAWDLLPWTFIIDYFTDFHDFVLAYNNTVPAQYIPGTIMTHRKAVSNVVTSLAPGYTGGSGSVVCEAKERTLASFATINAFLPNLGMDRLSILSSLFIQRFKR
ncbi:TPA_asm: maturation protein [ssRNA phage Esthiorhiza.1_12]|jgi:hypothetical protein|uniref:Maturation protein n=2 Tax=Leviviricetes TaxID=2842243 RepID=A0A8S5L2W6_9VIRU|nr:maturation protein [ssRNA phage Esthiorhiza.1_12]QDH88695.1 MAG: hypothetical protein H1RhizoLitter1497_000003 [Leviviridae sp.]DAD51735.1 TPA_asm: maturation protein [ssRNA phage Esthiorhiza.1_12]